tara:strand:+ start:51 stop:425 length:375 start_codon:yes stop_codon:yes gene_type:complete
MYKTNPPSNKNTHKKQEQQQQTPATNTTLNIWQETTNRYTFSISAENARTEPVVSFTKFASHLPSFSTIFTTNTVNRTRTTINLSPYYPIIIVRRFITLVLYLLAQTHNDSGGTNVVSVEFKCL